MTTLPPPNLIAVKDGDRAMRMAGAAYLITIVLGVYASLFVSSQLIVWDDAAATAANIGANERLFRSALAAELLMYAGVVVLSGCLYMGLRHVNKGLAMLGLCWRLTEVAVASVTIVMKLAVLDLLTSGENFASLSASQTQDLALLFVHLHGLSIYVILVFTGLGGAFLSYLLFKGRCVPRLLSLWGMLTYVQMFVGALVVLLYPQLWQLLQISFIPGGLFELVLGLWLLFNGARIHKAEPDLSRTPS